MRLKTIVGLATTLTLMAGTAAASHDAFSFGLSNHSPSVSADMSTRADFSAPQAGSTTHIEALKFAHEDGTGLTPEPDDGDTVAEVSIRARWISLFCATATVTMDGTWVSPMDSGGPVGAVAQIEFSLLGSTLDWWVVRSTSSHGDVDGTHYDLVADYGSGVCSSGDMSVDTTVFGTVGTNIVLENPSSCGTYDVLFAYGSNSLTDTYPITGCP